MRRATPGAVLTGAALLLSVWGCGAFRETQPARSATEQLLISTAADRAVEELPTDWAADRQVFLDDTRLEAYDRPYLLARLRQAVLDGGGSLATEAANADVVLEVASGALSTDKGTWLLGIPELPMPIPTGGETLKLPEVPIFKLETHVGKAKLLFSLVDPRTQSRTVEIPVCYGRVRHRFWWILFVGPFTWSELPEEMR